MMHLESPNVSVIGVTPVGAPGILSTHPPSPILFQPSLPSPFTIYFPSPSPSPSPPSSLANIYLLLNRNYDWEKYRHRVGGHQYIRGRARPVHLTGLFFSFLFLSPLPSPLSPSIRSSTLFSSLLLLSSHLLN